MTEPIYYYVDHTSRFDNNSGIQRCVRALARALLELGQPLIPVVWDRSTQQLAPAGAPALEHLARWSGPTATTWSPWRAPAAMTPNSWLLIVELVSGPHNPSRAQLMEATQPYGLRLAWLFHDAIPVRWARLYGAEAHQAASCHATYMTGLAQADRVFCNSHTSHQHLLEFLEQQGVTIKADRILPLLLAEAFGTRRPEPPTPKRPGESLNLLCVSTLEPRKNHRGLLKALAWLHSQGLRHWQLQLVGWAADPGVVAQLQRAQACGLPIQWHGRADDTLLAKLYAESDLTIYPSLEEGFGLPVAESLWQRRPCLCSGEGALAERAADGGCLTVNTKDWVSIAQGLERLLFHPALRLELGRQIDERSFRSWSTVAHELLNNLLRCER